MSVVDMNGVKIYNLTAGKAMPKWLTDRKRRKLSQDAEYRHRIEIIQDFGFPTSSQRVKMSRDGRYVVATGKWVGQVCVSDGLTD